MIWLREKVTASERSEVSLQPLQRERRGVDKRHFEVCAKAKKVPRQAGPFLRPALLQTLPPSPISRVSDRPAIRHASRVVRPVIETIGPSRIPIGRGVHIGPRISVIPHVSPRAISVGVGIRIGIGRACVHRPDSNANSDYDAGVRGRGSDDSENDCESEYCQCGFL